MRSLLIQDNKTFMQQLLLSEMFDPFCVVKAELETFCTFSVDGTYLSGYLDRDPEETAANGGGRTGTGTGAGENEGRKPDTYVPWKLLRPHFLSLIRGKSKPHGMRLVLRLAGRNVEKLVRQYDIPLLPEQIGGLFLNINYSNREGTEQITVITGTSVTVFTMDRTLEQTWDEMCGKLLTRGGIAFLVQ